MTVTRCLGYIGASLLALVIVATPVFISTAVGQADGASLAVEITYDKRGPWGETDAVKNVAGPAGQGTYDIFYPRQLGANDTRHPVVTWGNGNGSNPAVYEGLLRHLASWGFVVVASTSGAVGNGQAILAGAQYMVARNGDPNSRFHDKLDVRRVGAAGHSRGGAGALNAMLKSNGLLKSGLTVSTPQPGLRWPTESYQPSQLTRPALFLGADDDKIAPPRALASHYDPASGTAGMAVRLHTKHSSIQGSGGLFRGYVTAWLMYQLQDDSRAAKAFEGPRAELLVNIHWRNQHMKFRP